MLYCEEQTISYMGRIFTFARTEVYQLATSRQICDDTGNYYVIDPQQKQERSVLIRFKQAIILSVCKTFKFFDLPQNLYWCWSE